MAIRYSRGQVAARLSESLAKGKPIIVAAAGNGLFAKCIELGGADMIGVFASSKFRLDGYASSAANLPFGNANDIVYEIGEGHVLRMVKETPVVAGICATDPTRDMTRFMQQLAEAGFSGVQNYPSVGRYSDSYRRTLDDVGLGLDREVAVMAKARELDLYTIAYAWTPEAAERFAAAGVDMVAAHSGLTTGGAIGAKEARSLKESAEHTQAIILAARKVNPRVTVIAHGGPIERPEDLAYILAHTDSQGFIGASSMERLPVERAIVSVVQAFKALSLQSR